MSLLSSGQSDERIPAATVDELLRAVRIGLDELEVELQQANLDIVECEAHLAAAVDLHPQADRVVAARTAIEGVAVGSQEHLDKALDAARAHGAARIAAAEAEALWIVQEAREAIAGILVEPLPLDGPLQMPAPPAALPAVPSHAELTSWATPPAEDLARRTHPLEPGLPPAAPAPAALPPAPAVAAAAPAAASPPPRVVLAPEVQSAAELAFWAESTSAEHERSGGVDVALTAVSAVLVLAILTVLLLWIG